MSPTAQDFEAALRNSILQAASLNPPVRFTRFTKMINEYGGVAAAKTLLANRQVSEGFTQLFLSGTQNLKLSVEYLAQQTPWDELFTEEELNTARQRLEGIEIE